MSSFRTVDDLAERTFELETRLRSIRAQDLRVITGEYHRRCEGGAPMEVEVTSGIRMVCAACWSELVDRYGYHGARDRMHLARWTWETTGEYEVTKAEVQIPSRTGSNDAGLVALLSQWTVLQRLLFAEPRDTWATPGRPVRRCRRVDARRWGFALAAWRLSLHAKLGTPAMVALYAETCIAKGEEAARRLADWWTMEDAARIERYAGLWTEDRVRRWVERAREVVRARASRRPRMLEAA